MMALLLGIVGATDVKLQVAVCMKEVDPDAYSVLNT